LDQLKDQFMITASHELRTPLTAVQGYVELLTNFGEELTTKQYQEFLHKARQGCEELAVLLSNIMDASRLEVDMGLRPMYTSRVLVEDVIKSTLLIIEPQLTQEKREVQIYLPDHLAVMADPIRLRQVLMNISVNALKYSDPPAPISFFARVSSEPGHVLISIADKGKGIIQGEQARVFERFYRMENDINSPMRGSGLGLYISKRLLEAMGGKIWIESRGIAGEGSTFHIQLPIA
jgi:signal transduction histidine kinase